MVSNETVQTVCGGVVGFALFGVLVLMFGNATVSGKLTFHGGAIQGRIAQIVGIVGIVGILAGFYLVIGAIFRTALPYSWLAGSLFSLFVLVVIALRFSTILRRPRK